MDLKASLNRLNSIGTRSLSGPTRAHIGLAQTQPVDSSNNKDSTQLEPDLAQPSAPELFSLTLWVAWATPLWP